MESKGLVMKGHGEERVASMTKYPKWNRVNVIAWAKQTMEDGMCQSLSDTKAFKGKGTAQVLRQLVSEIDTIEAEMVALSAATKKVPGAAIYLAEHRRTVDGYMALRWRGVATRKHVSWEDAHGHYSRLSSTARSWYEQANERAQALNGQHLKLRKFTRDLRRNAQRREPHLFAKPIPGATSLA